jgi:hypothetical protein
MSNLAYHPIGGNVKETPCAPGVEHTIVALLFAALVKMAAV